MARAKYYEKLLLIPSESIATTLQYKPGWVVSTLIPPTKRTIVLSANGTRATQKAQVKTPLLLWLQQYALNKAKPGFEPTMYLYAAKQENKELWLAPYLIGNVHGDGRICWGARSNTPYNLRAAHSTFFTTPFSTDLWEGRDDVDDLERDSDYDASGNLRPGRRDALNKRLVNSFAKFAREYKVGEGEEGDEDEFTNDKKTAIYGEAHVSFPKHCDAVFVSSRPATMKKFPEKARRQDRHGRPFIVGFAIRRVKDWLVNVEGTSVSMTFDNKSLKTKKESAEAPAPPKVPTIPVARAVAPAPGIDLRFDYNSVRPQATPGSTSSYAQAEQEIARAWLNAPSGEAITVSSQEPPAIIVPEPVTPDPVATSLVEMIRQDIDNEIINDLRRQASEN